MKATQEIEPGIQASFDAAVTFQDKPLTVAGPADLIVDLHKEAEEYVARTGRVASVGPKLARVAVMEAPSVPEVLQGRRATIQAKFYDMANGTNLYEALKQKRQDARDLAMATRLGLLSIEDVSCAKHRKAISKLHGIV